MFPPSSLLIAYQSYLQTSSYSPTDLVSVSFGWFSYLHLVLNARVPKFLSSVLFLAFLELVASKSLQYHALTSCSVLKVLALRHFSVLMFCSSPLDVHSSSALPLIYTASDKVSCLTAS